MSATPGPWKVCDDPPNATWLRGRTISAADPDDARRVCDVFCYVTPPPANSMEEANARLIAAAPELLSCLKECLSDMVGEVGNQHADDYPLIVTARALIAKAEGK